MDGSAVEPLANTASMDDTDDTGKLVPKRFGGGDSCWGERG